jgi:hypothetical protein
VPYFAPELFRRVVLKDPLKTKALQKGVLQLCEEGATQVFRPLKNNDLILGAVGMLQFDVAAYRLKDEYGVEAVVEPVSVQTARWVNCDDPRCSSASRKGLREPGPGRRRAAGLPGADPGQPATDRGALAGDSLPGDAGASWSWPGRRASIPSSRSAPSPAPWAMGSSCRRATSSTRWTSTATAARPLGQAGRHRQRRPLLSAARLEDR